MNLGMSNIAGPRSNSVFGPNIVFAAFSKPFPTLSGTIQSVLVLKSMDQPCQLAAFLSPVSVFGYGAHQIILRAHPHDEKVIEPMPNFYESAATRERERCAGTTSMASAVIQSITSSLK